MAEYKIKSEYFVKGVKKVPFQSIPTNSKVDIFDKTQEIYLNRILDHLQKNLESQYSKILESEKNKAYQQGLQQGIKQTEVKYQAQINSTIELFRSIAKKLKDEYKKILEKEEYNILNLVMAISKKIINTEIVNNKDVVINSLKNSLNLISEKQNIKIYVNPKEWEHVQQNIKSLHLNFELPDDIEVSKSQEVKPGGCVIESEVGLIDATIDSQINEIERKLLK